MATDEVSEKRAFDAFIDRQFGGDLNGLTLEEALAQFREYQRDLERIRTKVAVAEQQYAQGEARPLDDDAIRSKLNQLMDDKGIPRSHFRRGARLSAAVWKL